MAARFLWRVFVSDYDLFGGYEPERPATLEEDKPEPPPPKGKKPRKRGGRGIYNTLAGLFVGGAIGLTAVVVILIMNPNLPFNPLPPRTVVPTPTLIVFGGGDQAGTPLAATRVPTAAPISGGALTATVQALVPTGITALPAGSTPLTSFPFTIQNEAVTYSRHPKGCNGLWLVGQVFDLKQQALVCGPIGRPLPCLPVQVNGDDFTSIQYTGSATQWGPSGYEVLLNSTPIEAEFEVQLLNSNGQPLSEPIIVRTLATCDQNVAVVNFIQIRDFSK